MRTGTGAQPPKDKTHTTPEHAELAGVFPPSCLPPASIPYPILSPSPPPPCGPSTPRAASLAPSRPFHLHARHALPRPHCRSAPHRSCSTPDPPHPPPVSLRCPWLAQAAAVLSSGRTSGGFVLVQTWGWRRGRRDFDLLCAFNLGGRKSARMKTFN